MTKQSTRTYFSIHYSMVSVVFGVSGNGLDGIAQGETKCYFSISTIDTNHECYLSKLISHFYIREYMGFTQKAVFTKFE